MLVQRICAVSYTHLDVYKRQVNTLEEQATADLKMNDIARITFKLAQPLMVDSYKSNRATGAFIVIDESTNNTVGAGMIV